MADNLAAATQQQSKSGKTINVVHLIESLGPGGAERLLYTNLKHLAGTNIKSSVVTVFAKPDDWVERIRALGVSVESLNCGSLRDLTRGAARLRSRLRRIQPDLVHTHLWAANVIGRTAGRLAGVPVISSIHNPDHEPEAWDDGSGVGLPKRQAVRELDRWTARFGCERMIAVSDYVRQSAHKQLHYPLARIELIYNPIDTEKFGTLQSASRKELLDTHGIPADGPILLNVGRVSPQKGLLFAIQAMPEILKSHPAAQLISIGPTTDSEWLARLNDEARRAGVSEHVHILGVQPNVEAYLSISDLFLFPSLYEGLGIALIEAMAMGRACVATNVGPIPEIVREGVNGRLVKPSDANEIARAVCSLLADKSKLADLGSRARESVLKRFAPEPAAERLAGVYESVMRRSGRTR